MTEVDDHVVPMKYRSRLAGPGSWVIERAEADGPAEVYRTRRRATARDLAKVLNEEHAKWHDDVTRFLVLQAAEQRAALACRRVVSPSGLLLPP